MLHSNYHPYWDFELFLPKVETPRYVAKLVCALLNTHKTAYIYIGQAKNTTDWIGIEKSVFDSIENALNSITPSVFGDLVYWDTNFSYETVDGKIVSAIIIEKSSSLYQLEDSLSFYYLYVKNKIITYSDSTDIIKMSNYLLSGLPYILNYEPSNTEKRSEQKKTQEDNKVEIHTIGDLPKGNYFYKYVDLETLLKSLKYNTVRFVEPTFWADKYESRFYNANYSSIHAPISETPFLYAYCLTYSRENEAAWKIYSYQKKGLGAHCVELRINRNRFREHLIKNLKNCKVFLGKVLYMDTAEINVLHARHRIKDGVENPTKHYDTYFSHFCLYSYLNLILLKRNAFTHEKEIRFFIIPNDADIHEKSHYENGKLEKKSEPLDIKIDWLDVIDAIQIDSNCSEIEIEILTDKINALIDARKDLTKKAKAELKKKLEPSPFDVYGKAEEIIIGEDIHSH